MIQKKNGARPLLSSAILTCGFLVWGNAVTFAQDQPATVNDIKTESVFATAEQMPEPTFDLKQYLSENVSYPDVAREEKVEGRIVAKFVVTKEGKIRDVSILRGLHPNCDKEVLTALSRMPDWKPGKQSGEPVDVYYTVPFTFTPKQ